MFVVSVEDADGRLYPIRYGAIASRLNGEDAGALALARRLSAGIGRSTTTMVETVAGRKDARAIAVSDLTSGVIARYVDGVDRVDLLAPAEGVSEADLEALALRDWMLA